MFTPATLIELIEANRKVDRTITYLAGEHDERRVSFADLYTRALGILYHLQKMGARRGDHLILFLGDNEPFIDAFWGAVLGGILELRPRPRPGDEHVSLRRDRARDLGAQPLGHRLGLVAGHPLQRASEDHDLAGNRAG